MTDFTKNFRLLLDADTKGAVDGLGSFSAAAKKADMTTAGASKGISGSFGDIVAKTGLGQKAMSTFGVSAQQMGTVATGAVVAAGGAFAKFALTGAQRFGDLGEEVEKFKGIAGTTAETASKWIAVADDYGVSSDNISTAIGKLGKALGANLKAFDEYGISVARTKDGNIDLEQTSFNVIDAYNKMQDPTQKAKLATEAFGKSYQTLIPLIDEGADKIKSSFDKVSKAQILNDKDLKSAEDYRLAMDNLHETVSDLQLTIGKQLIPVIVDMGNTITSVTGPLNDFGDALPIVSLGSFKTALDTLINPAESLVTHFGDLKDTVGGWFATQTVVGPYITQMEHATDGVGQFVKGLDLSAIAAAAAVVQDKELVKTTALMVKGYEARLSALHDITNATLAQNDAALGSQDADLAALDAIDKYNESLAANHDKLKDNNLTQRELNQAFIDVQKELNNTAGSFVTYKQGLAEMAGVTYTDRDAINDQITSLEKSASTLKPGSELWLALQEHIRQLHEAAAAAAGYVNQATQIGNIGGAGAGAVKGKKAAGGPVSAGSTYLVGEKGPEFFMPGSSGTIVPHGGSASWGGGGTTINYITVEVSPTADKVAIGREIKEVLSAYEKVNG